MEGKRSKRENSFEFGEWLISSTQGHILQSAGEERESFQSELNLPQLPDMTFHNNSLSLVHKRHGFGIEFSALEALKQVDSKCDKLKVAVAEEWRQARADSEYIDNIVKPFDWTFTTDYRGTLLIGQDVSRVHSTPDVFDSDEGSRTNEKGDGGPGLVCRTEQDLVCSGGGDNNLALTKQLAPPSVEKSSVSFSKESILVAIETDDRIDYEKLSIREPILQFTELTLYEDELGDNGCSCLSLKFRAMPSGFFLLLRFYLRVDDVIVRLHETRYRYESGQFYMLREYTEREASFNKLCIEKGVPLNTIINPNEIGVHLTETRSDFEKLIFPFQ